MNTTAPISVLRMKAVILQLGLSRSGVYDRINPHSPRFDPDFPRPFKIGPSAIGWAKHEVDAWVAARISARNILEKN